ncbi:MAG: hypothetical protein LBT08_07395 [Synergistaceae bacterium]|nr:hypothetical protein [Synergistaceae bacterium]
MNNGAVSAGKGGSTSSSGSTTVPQPYDSNTLMGQLMNDATQKTYASNARYDDLLSQAPGITGQIHDVLGQAQTRRAIRGMTRRWARMISQAGLSGKARTRWITRGRPTL